MGFDVDFDRISAIFQEMYEAGVSREMLEDTFDVRIAECPVDCLQIAYRKISNTEYEFHGGRCWSTLGEHYMTSNDLYHKLQIDCHIMEQIAGGLLEDIGFKANEIDSNDLDIARAEILIYELEQWAEITDPASEYSDPQDRGNNSKVHQAILEVIRFINERRRKVVDG